MDCVFIGYATNNKASRFLVHKSEHPDIHDNTVMESNSAELFEHIYPYKTSLESSCWGSEQPREEPKKNKQNEESQRLTKRQKTSTSFESHFVTFLLESEPQTFKEAMLSSDSTCWKEVVNSEIESILSNHTWELVDLPSGNKVWF